MNPEPQQQKYTHIMKGALTSWNVSQKVFAVDLKINGLTDEIALVAVPRFGLYGFAVGDFTNESTPTTWEGLSGTLSRIELFENSEAVYYESWSVPTSTSTLFSPELYLRELSGDDYFLGSADSTGTDALQSMGGNDRFKGFYDDGPGHWHGDHSKGDFFYGGDGLDTSIYQGKISEYTITSSATSTDRVDIYDLRLDDGTRVPGFYVEDSVARRDGNDRLVEVERLEFEVAEENGANRIALDIDGNAGTAAKMVGVLRGKEDLSNLKLIGALIYNLDAGMSYEDLLGVALDVLLGANKTNEAIADLVYTNLVGESPTLEVRRELASYMDSGAYSQAGFARAIADLELNATNINLVGLSDTGLQYTEYVP